MSENEYLKGPRNTVKRIRNRGFYDFKTVHEIFSQAPIVHVSFTPTSDDLFPTILPMIGFIGNFEQPDSPLSSGGQDIYLHGHSAARLMKLPEDSGNPALTEDGLPVCVAATHIDGIVVSLTPFHNSMNYRSAVAHGFASAVSDEAERLWAMERITDGVVPGRWADSRQPTKAELLSTGIIKVKIVSASAKVRTGGPGEDRKDEKDDSVRGKYWTGVIPSNFSFGEPVDAATNRVPIPGYISQWVSTHNAEVKQKAQGALQEQ